MAANLLCGTRRVSGRLFLQRTCVLLKTIVRALAVENTDTGEKLHIDLAGNFFNTRLELRERLQRK